MTYACRAQGSVCNLEGGFEAVYSGLGMEALGFLHSLFNLGPAPRCSPETSYPIHTVAFNSRGTIQREQEQKYSSDAIPIIFSDRTTGKTCTFLVPFQDFGAA